MTEQPPTLQNPSVIQGSKPRYEIHVDDSGEPAGKTYFTDHESVQGVHQRIFPHTEVGEEFGGHGLASTLVRRALDASIAQGYRIVAVCPYVKGWLEKHPEYQEHVDPTTPEHLQALQNR
ncbi:GNAT family N-acetyltransferase [Citricoccus nitrophenolicus]|uniref:GNAT family N-acetyltransferase n=1 Tax=Citricoccus nitrophenolicus TaxID=863575 RepID=UPI0031ED7D50